MLQCFSFGGRLFVERCLTFGCSSSASLFDQSIDVIVKLSTHMANLPNDFICRQLDDAMGVSSLSVLEQWTDKYSELCQQIGVRLAPNIDGKAFLASRQGVLLGTYFDLDRWTWSIEQKKLSKLLILLHDMVDNDTVSTQMLEKLTGKITHYYPIFSGGILIKYSYQYYLLFS